jgi:uncharacterized protein YutE (UPF0331/DUF86 family)
VRERLLKLEEVISNLESTGTLDANALRSNFRHAWTAERGLQLGAEAILDVGNHILSAHFGVTAKDYEDIITQLAARAVIDDALREKLKGLGGFRNVLVHGYLRIDPVRVAEHLARAPAHFSEFARQIRGWLSRVAPTS